MKKFSKTRLSIVNVMGDLYYKELPVDQAFEMVFEIIPEDQAPKN